MLSLALECSSGHISKCIFDINTIKSTRLIKHHVVILFAPSFAFASGDFSSVLLVDFVAEADEGEVVGVAGTSIFDESLLPLIETMETIEVSDVVAQRAAVGSTVESVSERLELLLASGIPDLESHDSVIDKDFFLGEISSDSRLGLSLHLTVEILLQKSGLSNTGVTQNDNLEEVLLLGHLLQTNTVKRLNTCFY